ncbi:hypothetical protein J2X34_002102 [Rhodococcus sp. BE178]
MEEELPLPGNPADSGTDPGYAENRSTACLTHFARPGG